MLTEEVVSRASTAYEMIKKVIEPYYHGKISLFVGVSYRSIPFDSSALGFGKSYFA